MAARCEITDLLTDSCGHCNGAEARAAQEARAGLGPWFTAQYESACAGCEEAVEPGDTIRADGKGGYLCEGCGRDAGGAG
jgi:hypothetical protein